MIFHKTPLIGAYLIEPERISDERGFFARTFCKNEFKQHDLNTNLEQCNISYNKKLGTLRGMHFQIEPYSEVKVVRCTMGGIYDVIIDLRKDSPTFKKWSSFELTNNNRLMLYIPKGFAHGFQTLSDDTEVFYQMSSSFEPLASRGIRWDDPNFKIKWPHPVSVISQKDQQYPQFL